VDQDKYNGDTVTQIIPFLQMFVLQLPKIKTKFLFWNFRKMRFRGLEQILSQSVNLPYRQLSNQFV